MIMFETKQKCGQEVFIVVLWEHYSMKGSAPLWSSTFHTVVLQGRALQYGRYCSTLEQYLPYCSAPGWSTTVKKVPQSLAYCSAPPWSTTVWKVLLQSGALPFIL